MPVFTTAGGNRTALAGYSPGITNGRVMPTCNHDCRDVFQDDLTISKGRHSSKFGVYVENDETLAPINATNYMGNYNFGSANTNPLDSGNGYANMLLGVVTQYSESTNRVAWEVGHWEVDGYAQDTWRVNSRLTIDYGFRITRNGAWYDENNSTAAFYPELYDRSKAVRLYRPICTNGAAGNVACPAANQALKARYWGPTNVDRTHNLTVNYGYVIPTLASGHRILNAALGNWQVSGVTKLLSGTTVNVTCANTTTRGVAYSQPSLTNGVTARYFNLAAFAMPSPSATVGDFGNAPLGLLRNPTASVWDITIERRIPVKGVNGKGVRFPFQAYNVFNQVVFTTLNAALTYTGANNQTETNTTAGTYFNPNSAQNVLNPRQLGVTLRFDF